MPSSTSFVQSLDHHGAWRHELHERVRALGRFLREHELLDESAGELLDALRLRLGGEKLIVAFVAEFSRGKSELINAIFFADMGQRILPATPGRTTMCPVELGYDPEEPPGLALLPIETRLDAQPLAELRRKPQAWSLLPLDLNDAPSLAQTLTEVMRTRRVSVEEARALGFWDDERTDENPPQDANGDVEVPAWRHALINVPHPLLKRGLVVLDTPGLNAIGAEPELTLSLLPSAHASVFILGADTGVTKSDLAVWREHLSSQGLSRYVALNKIDTLADALSSSAQTEGHIERQCSDVSRTLGLPRERVFPISAKQALHARVEGDRDKLTLSRLPALEAALAEELIPQRRDVLAQLALEGLAPIETQVLRMLGDRRRQFSEQILEMRGLRGKNAGKVRLMLARVDAESAEFEQCIGRLQAMRAVHARMLKHALQDLASEAVREEVDIMHKAIGGSLLPIGARKDFGKLCKQLRERLSVAQARGVEIQRMLEASFTQLNAEFGFSLMVARGPDLTRFVRDLELIERNYAQYLGVTQAFRLSQPRFLEQFRRMLISRLRVVFENASSELELWNKTASAQIDAQLRDRRRGFKRRREALERIQTAAGELEQRLMELESQDARLQQLQLGLTELIEAVRSQAQAMPSGAATQPAARENGPGLPAELMSLDLSLDAPAGA